MIFRRGAIGKQALGGLRLADSQRKPGEVQALTNLKFTVKSNKTGSLPWLGLNIGLRGSREITYIRNRNDARRDPWQLNLSAGPRVFVPIPAISAFVYARVAGGTGYARGRKASTGRSASSSSHRPRRPT